MNDKEKQIEEMAKLICPSYEKKADCETCSMEWCYADEYATILFCNGYRKIPENAFILTDDNAEELANLIVTSPQMQSVMSDLIKAWQKETAREIYRELCGHGTTYVKKWIKERYGVDATENENEC